MKLGQNKKQLFGSLVFSALAGMALSTGTAEAGKGAKKAQAAGPDCSCQPTCAGKSDCKGCTNDSCKGQNGCHGHGFIKVTAGPGAEKECKDKGGVWTNKKS